MKTMTRQNLAIIVFILLAAALLTFGLPWTSGFLLHPSDGFLPLCMQIFTCHLVHFTVEHFAYDVLCFVVMAFILSWKKLLVLLPVSFLTVSLAILIFHPELESYGGLSGVSCGLYTLLCHELSQKKHWMGFTAFMILAAKTALEIHFNQTCFFTSSAVIPIHMAHVAGMLSALPLILYSEIGKHQKAAIHYSPTTTL